MIENTDLEELLERTTKTKKRKPEDHLPKTLTFTRSAYIKAKLIGPLVKKIAESDYEWSAFLLARKKDPTFTIRDLLIQKGQDIRYGNVTIDGTAVAQAQARIEKTQLYVIGWIHGHGNSQYLMPSLTDKTNFDTVLNSVGLNTEQQIRTPLQLIETKVTEKEDNGRIILTGSSSHDAIIEFIAEEGLRKQLLEGKIKQEVYENTLLGFACFIIMSNNLKVTPYAAIQYSTETAITNTKTTARLLEHLRIDAIKTPDDIAVTVESLENEIRENILMPIQPKFFVPEPLPPAVFKRKRKKGELQQVTETGHTTPYSQYPYLIDPSGTQQKPTTTKFRPTLIISGNAMSALEQKLDKMTQEGKNPCEIQTFLQMAKELSELWAPTTQQIDTFIKKYETQEPAAVQEPTTLTTDIPTPALDIPTTQHPAEETACDTAAQYVAETEKPPTKEMLPLTSPPTQETQQAQAPKETDRTTIPLIAQADTHSKEKTAQPENTCYFQDRVFIGNELDTLETTLEQLEQQGKDTSILKDLTRIAREIAQLSLDPPSEKINQLVNTYLGNNQPPAPEKKEEKPKTVYVYATSLSDIEHRLEQLEKQGQDTKRWRNFLTIINRGDIYEKQKLIDAYVTDKKAPPELNAQRTCESKKESTPALDIPTAQHPAEETAYDTAAQYVAETEEPPTKDTAPQTTQTSQESPQTQAQILPEALQEKAQVLPDVLPAQTPAQTSQEAPQTKTLRDIDTEIVQLLAQAMAQEKEQAPKQQHTQVSTLEPAKPSTAALQPPTQVIDTHAKEKTAQPEKTKYQNITLVRTDLEMLETILEPLENQGRDTSRLKDLAQMTKEVAQLFWGSWTPPSEKVNQLVKRYLGNTQPPAPEKKQERRKYIHVYASALETLENTLEQFETQGQDTKRWRNFLTIINSDHIYEPKELIGAYVTDKTDKKATAKSRTPRNYEAKKKPTSEQTQEQATLQTPIAQHPAEETACDTAAQYVAETEKPPTKEMLPLTPPTTQETQQAQQSQMQASRAKTSKEIDEEVLQFLSQVEDNKLKERPKRIYSTLLIYGHELDTLENTLRQLEKQGQDTSRLKYLIQMTQDVATAAPPFDPTDEEVKQVVTHYLGEATAAQITAAQIRKKGSIKDVLISCPMLDKLEKIIEQFWKEGKDTSQWETFLQMITEHDLANHKRLIDAYVTGKKASAEPQAAKKQDKTIQASSNTIRLYEKIEFQPETPELIPLSFDKSIERLLHAGFDRHPMPAEVYSLIIDRIKGKLTESLQEIADYFLSPTTNNWLDMVVWNDGYNLRFYEHPRNLEFVSHGYVFKKMTWDRELKLNFQECKCWYTINEIARICPELVTYLWSCPFEEIPKEMHNYELWLPHKGKGAPIAISEKYMTPVLSAVSRGIRELRQEPK